MSARHLGQPIDRLCAPVVFAGEHVLGACTLSLRDGRITALTSGLDPEAYQVPIIAPGFIDLQINGADDLLFTDSPDLATLQRLGRVARRHGTTGFLPTVMSAPLATVRRAVEAIEQARAHDVPGVLGVHLEGPYLSPDKPGVHDPAALRHLTLAEAETLPLVEGGVTLITLAPERAEPGAIRSLVHRGAVVFAGHSTADGAVMARAQREGLSGVTHLFNAMGGLSARAPGLLGTALSEPNLACSVIADGHHVQAPCLRLALRTCPRLLLISDAMPTLGTTRHGFCLRGQRVTLHDGALRDAEGRLAGAHLGLDRAVTGIIHHGEAGRLRALRMASTLPAQVVRLAGELGVVRPGARACLTLLDEALSVQGVCVDGVLYPRETALPQAPAMAQGALS